METIQEIDEALIKCALTDIRAARGAALCGALSDAEAKVTGEDYLDSASERGALIFKRKEIILEWMRRQCAESWGSSYSEVLGDRFTPEGKANRIALLNKALEHFCPKSKEV